MNRSKLLTLALVLSLATLANSQTTPPQPADPFETGWNIMLGGNYMNATNAATNNGVLTTQGLRVAQHWVARSDQYITLSPSGVLVLAGAEYRESLAHLFPKSNTYAVNAEKMEAFVNLEVGTARTSTTTSSGTTLSTAKFAWGVGGGFDIKLTDTTSLRPLDIKYVRAGMLTNGGQLLGNHVDFAAGLNLRF
jgi:hypothetical protein